MVQNEWLEWYGLFTVLSFTVTAKNGEAVPVNNVGVSNAPSKYFCRKKAS